MFSWLGDMSALSAGVIPVGVCHCASHGVIGRCYYGRCLLPAKTKLAGRRSRGCSSLSMLPLLLHGELTVVVPTQGAIEFMLMSDRAEEAFQLAKVISIAARE